VLLLPLLGLGGIKVDVVIDISLISRAYLTLLDLFNIVELFNSIDDTATTLPSLLPALSMLLLSLLCFRGIDVNIKLIISITPLEIFNILKLLDTINDATATLASLLSSFSMLFLSLFSLCGIRVNIKAITNVTLFKVPSFVELFYTVDEASAAFSSLLSAFPVLLLSFLSGFISVEGGISFLDIALFERCSGETGEGLELDIIAKGVDYVSSSNMALVGNSGSTEKGLVKCLKL
jgi:uncharacterized protein involved in response to NO